MGNAAPNEKKEVTNARGRRPKRKEEEGVLSSNADRLGQADFRFLKMGVGGRRGREWEAGQVACPAQGQDALSSATKS